MDEDVRKKAFNKIVFKICEKLESDLEFRQKVRNAILQKHCKEKLIEDYETQPCVNINFKDLK